MVAISEVRAQLKDLSRYGSGLVAVFVGGTSGIGESTAREFVRYTTKPRVYIVGRSQEAADKLISEFKKINSQSQINFIKSDVSLLRNVDEVCGQIKAKEEKVNLLCLSAGIMTLGGRNETAEGLDKKYSLHYYSRLRFTEQLLPLLSKAAESPAEEGKQPMSRIISVLGAGFEGQVNLDDFALKNTFSVKRCADHAISGTSLAFDLLSKDPAASGTTFIHSSPGGVMTNISRELPKAMQFLYSGLGVIAKPFLMDFQESGERHVWASTSDTFANGGLFLLGQSGNTQTSKIFQTLRADGTEEKVWQHTRDVFNKICDEGGKY